MRPLEPGDPDRVGGYRLLGRLGAGGMAIVYFGRSPGRRAAAVKVMHTDLAAEPAYRERAAAVPADGPGAVGAAIGVLAGRLPLLPRPGPLRRLDRRRAGRSRGRSSTGDDMAEDVSGDA